MNQNKILLFCSVGFIIQMYMLIMQYIQFNTVVNVDYETSNYQSLPAITICLPRLLSMKKVVEYFQRDNSSSEQCVKVTKAYEMYQIALRNFSSIENNSMTKNEFMESIYRDEFQNLIPNLTIMELYQMSIPISNESSIKLEGFQLNPDGSSSFIKDYSHSPIESLILDYKYKESAKCFTFFSHLDEWYRNKYINLHFMSLSLVHDQTDFPLSIYNDNKFSSSYAIHSGKTMPTDYEQFDWFEHKKFNVVEFNRLTIQLLKSPYKTNCKDYDQSGKKSFSSPVRIIETIMMNIH